ncbi:hypothetical protein EVAR_13077_1 [Eumeta japonica]|uniref:Uncharacterized protein n=1 Tax=Eumeta variegata TaxID=151549 RepID=A0A4C2A641_EUMVA|nr:hypothetical protein EVAR_13077_1 [Eumeta japonica]
MKYTHAITLRSVESYKRNTSQDFSKVNFGGVHTLRFGLPPHARGSARPQQSDPTCSIFALEALLLERGTLRACTDLQ